jgi:serine/threonine-protein kinase HipA
VTAHRLALWRHEQHVADLSYDALADDWRLAYAPAWCENLKAFGLSPALPLHPPQEGYNSKSVRRFIENLLPEGRALDIAASAKGVAKTNIYGLIHELGAETTGAFRFLPDGVDGAIQQPLNELRQVSLAELDSRIADRDTEPFVVWDGKVRMSVAGYQDKLLVYIDGDVADVERGAPMFLPDYPLASTHILKPQPMGTDFPHMVVNEHYCMSLARVMGLPVAEVAILRTPRPVLAVKRFDRQVRKTLESGHAAVDRLHVIDLCQACDVPVSYKYERNVGSTGAAAQYRDGTSFASLFSQVANVHRKAAEKLAMLRWALFQLVIGNCDAHGKNYSFFVSDEGLSSAPWYDLVSVVQYPQVSHELAMAFGDEFDIHQVKSFALADFASRCEIDRKLLHREAKRLADGVRKHAARLVETGPYGLEERLFAQKLQAGVLQRSTVLELTAQEAVRIKAEYL